jgi:hypothetical protein
MLSSAQVFYALPRPWKGQGLPFAFVNAKGLAGPHSRRGLFSAVSHGFDAEHYFDHNATGD